MSNWTSMFGLVNCAFCLFLLWLFFPNKAKIYGKFQGIWGSICKQQLPPLLGSVSKLCLVQYHSTIVPRSQGSRVPSCSDSPTQTQPPRPRRPVLLPHCRYLAHWPHMESVKHTLPVNSVKEKWNRIKGFQEMTSLGRRQLSTRAEWRADV